VIVPKRLNTPELSELDLLLDTAGPVDASDGGAEVHGASGHRARLRSRLLKAGPDSLADHEVLEMMLFLALPRRDTKPIARALVARFGSYARAIAAPVPDLLAVEGLGLSGTAALKIVQAAALRLVKADVIYRPVLNHWDRLIEYLTAVLSREQVEQARFSIIATG
jgi:DNA repair protein RadC